MQQILVVDDEIYIVHILDFSLGMEGYEVLTALDGEQAELVQKALAEWANRFVNVFRPRLEKLLRDTQ